MESTIAKALMIILENHASNDFNYTHNNVHTERERESKRENILNPKKFTQIRREKNIIIHTDTIKMN